MNTVKTKATTAGLASVQPSQEPQPRMPVFSTSSGMSLLWQKASGKMSLRELEWLADGAAQQVESDARALADVLMSTGCLVSSDDGKAGSFEDPGNTSYLIFNLHHQLDTIAGLANIAADASYRARLALKG